MRIRAAISSLSSAAAIDTSSRRADQLKRERCMNLADIEGKSTSEAAVSSVTTTRLSGPWLIIARTVWLVLVVPSLGLFVASIPSYIAYLHLLCTGTSAACSTSGQLTPGDVRRLHELGLSLDFYATYIIVIVSMYALGYWLVAAFLFWRKSDDRLALLAAVSLALCPIVFNAGLINTLPSPWWFLAHALSVLGFLCIILFGYVFPSGHFVPSFTRWVTVVALVYWGSMHSFLPLLLTLSLPPRCSVAWSFSVCLAVASSCRSIAIGWCPMQPSASRPSGWSMECHWSGERTWCSLPSLFSFPHSSSLARL